MKTKQYPVESFFAIRSITGFSISPSGKTIAYTTNTSGTPNIWTISIDGGWTNQITIGQYQIPGFSYIPNKNDIVFFSDEKGNENFQLYRISDKGGEVSYLTPEHKGSKIFPLLIWNSKGTQGLFCSNKRSKSFFDTYLLDLNTGKQKCIFTPETPGFNIPLAWSKDQKQLLLQSVKSTSTSELLLYNIQTKELKNISGNSKDTSVGNAKFNKENNKIYYLTDEGREFSGIMEYNIKTGAKQWFVKEKWDVIDFKFSKSEKYFLWIVNENGTSKIKLKNTKSKKLVPLKLPLCNCRSVQFTSDEKKLIFLLDTPQNPKDLYNYDIGSKKLQQITFSMIGGIKKDDFVKPKIINYKSFDGLRISALLYVPPGMKKDGSNPAIVYCHGGPEWQEKPIFHQFIQSIINRGYVLIAPNFRGSTGYGRSFQKLIHKDWGGDEFKDMLSSVDYLKNSGYVDKKKIAVVGGSFGGFMTLTCLTKAPGIWKCGVDICGPSNLFTFIKSVPESWRPYMDALVGHPEKDKALLTERSPINFTDNIQSPLLVIQGLHDPRVVKAEADQIVDRLKSQNKTIEYLIHEDEGHGATKVVNQIKEMKLICEFLQKHLN